MMKRHYSVDPWILKTTEWNPSRNLIDESVFSIGNAALGTRANFEEKYSGESLRGSYLAGVYYPDKTRVGWWKNGYPEYFAKILNAVNWIGVDLYIDGQILDWNEVDILSFERKLDMKTGLYSKSIEFQMADGHFAVHSRRFCSMATKHLTGLDYTVENKSDREATLTMRSYLDFDVRNRDANYDEKFWLIQGSGEMDGRLYVHSATKKTDFHVVAAMVNDFSQGEMKSIIESEKVNEEVQVSLAPGDSLKLRKLCCLQSSLKLPKKGLLQDTMTKCHEAERKTYEAVLQEHMDCWASYWETHDVEISGDPAAQQGMRFCIFQFLQSFDGHHPDLNIGPKGFTGEKYGGLSYWDTEAFCLAYVLNRFQPQVAKDLLLYRYHHLAKAIENATKLGFKDGAALYPMVTINGEECHNEWEITFEEIHRNGAMVYAIWLEAQYTGNTEYYYSKGAEIIIAIARFWAQRVNYSEHKKAYVMLGVTGPNEYENNVNNNWYTNFLAQWTLNMAAEIAQSSEYKGVKIAAEEIKTWEEIADQMYLPVHPHDPDIKLQQDGFLDKELRSVETIPEEEIPIHHHWSWDRILRSCFIKQADVLQGMSMFPMDFKKEELRKNLEFYLPMTVHESSLSPSVHAMVSAWTGKSEEAYQLFLRSCRLDIDDYNADARDGLHITSMPGAWNALFQGIVGLQWQEGHLKAVETAWPKHWEQVRFTFQYRGIEVTCQCDRDQWKLSADAELSLNYKNKRYTNESDISKPIIIKK